MKAVMLGYWVIFLGVVLQVFALLWDVVDDLAGEEALGGPAHPREAGHPRTGCGDPWPRLGVQAGAKTPELGQR
jgi:hypothetical protein